MDAEKAIVIKQDALPETYRQKVELFISQNVGIQLPKNKHILIESRLRKRQRILKLASLVQYVDYALAPENSTAERLHLIDALTTNKTDFYREANHFAFLRDKIENKLSNNRVWTFSTPFRAWSAGCSSGEEPYTLAIELSEIKRKHPTFHFEIDATDISVSCLQKARDGIYPFERITPIPLPLRKRYLYKSKKPDKKLVAISDDLQKTVRFFTFNLLTSSYDKFNYYDVIFCRNVLIYFSLQDREKIVRNLTLSLKPGGLLIVGHSETLSGSSSPVSRLKPTIYQRQKSKSYRQTE